jgi:hypothetical protein
VSAREALRLVGELAEREVGGGVAAREGHAGGRRGAPCGGRLGLGLGRGAARARVGRRELRRVGAQARAASDSQNSRAAVDAVPDKISATEACGPHTASFFDRFVAQYSRLQKVGCGQLEPTTVDCTHPIACKRIHSTPTAKIRRVHA